MEVKPLANRACYTEAEARKASFLPGDFLIEMVDESEGTRSFELCRVADHWKRFEHFHGSGAGELLNRVDVLIPLMTWRCVPAARDYPTATYTRTLNHLGETVLDGERLLAFFAEHGPALGISL